MGGNDTRALDAEAAPWREVYRRLTEIVVPRPIALVSSVDREGRLNLAPFSFFTVVSANPPLVAVAPLLSGRTGEAKDTLHNVVETEEFVVAAVTDTIAERVNQASAPLPRGESEFQHAGFTPVPAEKVSPPRVAESPVNMECRLVEVRRYGEDPGAGNLIVGRVVLIHLAESLLDADGQVLPNRLRAVARMGGRSWARTDDLFEMERPGT